LYGGEVKFTTAHDVLWFVENRSLTIGGIDIFNLTNEEVPRKSLGTMNGYNNKKVNVEVDKSIVELYIKVTKKQKFYKRCHVLV
jgi:hypothetical protein